MSGAVGRSTEYQNPKSCAFAGVLQLVGDPALTANHKLCNDP